MLRAILRRWLPRPLIRAWRRRKFNPRLRAIGITPRPARAPIMFLGSEYGGFAIDPATVGPTSVIYSLGAGEDISFEEELVARTGCHVHIYDPTPRSLAWLAARLGPPGADSHFTVHPLGVWSEDARLKFYAPADPAHASFSIANLQHTQTYIEAECVSLTSAMAANGHQRIDLLKLNVEGAEYAILDAALDAGVRPGMILLNYDELHTDADAQAQQRLITLARRITAAGYTTVFAEVARVAYVRAG